MKIIYYILSKYILTLASKMYFGSGGINYLDEFAIGRALLKAPENSHLFAIVYVINHPDDLHDFYTCNSFDDLYVMVTKFIYPNECELKVEDKGDVFELTYVEDQTSICTTWYVFGVSKDMITELLNKVKLNFNV